VHLSNNFGILSGDALQETKAVTQTPTIPTTPTSLPSLAEVIATLAWMEETIGRVEPWNPRPSKIEADSTET